MSKEYSNKRTSLVINDFLLDFFVKLNHLYKIANLYFLNFLTIIEDEKEIAAYSFPIKSIALICCRIFLKLSSGGIS